MECTIEELTDDIVRIIEREDFIYVIKYYSSFIVKTTVKNIIDWWEQI